MLDLHYGRLALPKNWSVQAQLTVTPPDGIGTNGLKPALQITSTKIQAGQPADIATLRQNQRHDLAQSLPHFRVLQEGTLKRPDGSSVPFLSFSFVLQKGVALKQAQIIEIVDGQVVHATATAPFSIDKQDWAQLLGVLASYSQ